MYLFIITYHNIIPNWSNLPSVCTSYLSPSIERPPPGSNNGKRGAAPRLGFFWGPKKRGALAKHFFDETSVVVLSVKGSRSWFEIHGRFHVRDNQRLPKSYRAQLEKTKTTANNRGVHQQKLRTKTTFRRQDPKTALAISRDHPCKIAGI